MKFFSKSNGSQRWGSRVFAPAVAVMSRLSYAGKFAVISLLFILPTGWVTAQFVSEIDERIDFAERELRGVAYLRPLRTLLEEVTDSWRQSGRPVADSDAARLSRTHQLAAMERGIERLHEEKRLLGTPHNTSDHLAAIESGWRDLRDAHPPAAPQDVDRIHRELIGSLRRQMTFVGDRSSLILDPDLDSYYLMDAVLLKLPERQILLAEHQRFLRDALADGKIDEQEKTEPIRFAALLDANVAESKRGMRTAYENHASGQLEARLDPSVRAASDDAARLGASLRELIAGDPSGPTGAEYEQKTADSLRMSFQLWDQSAAELEGLLQARKSHFIHKRRIVLSILAAAMVLVVYLWIGFYAGVTQTIETLEGATKRLVLGDFSEPPAVATRDELVKVGAAFGEIAGRLREEWRQSRDEAERARVAETGLRASEERFQLAVRGSTDGLWDWDLKTNVVYYSPRFKELLGYKDSEFENVFSSFETRLSPDDREPILAALEAHIQRRVPYDVKYRLQCRSGKYRWFRARGQAVWDADGQASRMAGSITDVTEQQVAETALNWERFLLQTLLGYLPDCIYFKDTEGRFLRVSQSLALQCGRERPEDLVGRTDADFFPAEYAARARADEEEMLRTGAPLIGKEERPHWATGTEAWVSTTKVPLRSEGGVILGSFGISHDITAQKEAETRFRRVVDAAPNPLVAVSQEGEIQLVNAAAEQLFGYAREELVGQPIEILLPDRVRNVHEKYRSDYFRSPQARVMGQGRELTARRRDGTEFPVEVGLSPLRFGEETVVLSSVLDVTVRKQAEETLIRAKVAAESANRAKSDFLANMSHEIRTPMNAVIGMTELLLDSDLTAVQRDYLSTVLESAESLMGIINEILDFSKIEAGHLELASVEMDLRELIPDTLRSLAPRAFRKGLELVWHVHPEGPYLVRGDPQRIRQILVNLVGNAIKFTEAGEVVVDMRCESSTPTEVRLACDIRDTGIGVPKNRREAIFRPFEQADSTTTRSYGGTGLGLSISTRLVEAMGGSIRVESEVGVGSTFSFSLQLGMASGEPGESRLTGKSDLHDVGVLVVDDNATNRRVLQEMLELRGMRVAAVESADAALAWLREAFHQGRKVPLLLSDVNMPGKDGYMLAEQIRTSRDWREMAIILLTSGGRPGDTARAEALGVVAHLMKPVKQSELFAAIVRAVQSQPGAMPASRKPDAGKEAFAAHPTPLRVLLAEDGLANQKLAVGLLSRWGHDVVVATNGRDAVNYAEAGTFDIVLMDINMPEMDGLEATREIRRRESTTGRHTPIVAMTAHALKGDRERCLAAGMDSYLSKPIRRDELLKELVALGHPTAAGVSKGAETMRPEADVAPHARERRHDTMPAPGVRMPEIDWNRILQGLEGDRDLLCSVLEACLDECPGLNERLERAVAAGDGEAVAKAAHAIKGTLRILELEPATSMLETFESQGKSGDVAMVAAGLPRWQAIWDELQQVIQSFVRTSRGEAS